MPPNYSFITLLYVVVPTEDTACKVNTPHKQCCVNSSVNGKAHALNLIKANLCFVVRVSYVEKLMLTFISHSANCF